MCGQLWQLFSASWFITYSKLPPTVEKKTLLTVSVILLLILGGLFVFQVTKDITREITEREVARITQQEIGRITSEEIERITDQRTQEITDGLLGGVSQAKDSACKLVRKQREFSSTPYYTGPLLDAHVHMPVSSALVSAVAMQLGFEDMPTLGDIPVDHIICVFDSEGITALFGFFLMPNVAIGQTVRTIKDAEERFPGKIITFFMPPPIHSINPEPGDVEEVLDDNAGLFRGYGEMAFEQGTFTEAHPEDPEFLEMYDLADAHKLIVMMHPRADQKQAVERILKSHPTTNFLLHGDGSQAWIAQLMETYPNVYYSVDATITSIYWFAPQHDDKGPTKEEWLAYFRQNFDSLLQNAVREWKPAIEAHPDRFLWAAEIGRASCRE